MQKWTIWTVGIWWAWHGTPMGTRKGTWSDPTTRGAVEGLEGQESEVNNSGSRHSFDFKIFGSKGEKPRALLEGGFRMSFPKGWGSGWHSWCDMPYHECPSFPGTRASFFFLNSGQEAGSEKIHNPGFPELTLENRNRERFFAQTPPVGPLVSVQGHGNAFPIVLKCTVIIRAFSHWGKDSPHHDSPSLVCSTYLFIWGAEHSNLCFPLLTA